MPLRFLQHGILKSQQAPSTVASVEKAFELDGPLLSEPDYFESIDQLMAWGGTTNTPTALATTAHAFSQTNDLVIHSASGRRPRLLVCHDFKGGYTEDPFERGYSFEFWHLVDTFVYFSHKRITLPPQGWVDVGHRHGSKVLGTVIFEWAESKPDLERCLYGGSIHAMKPVTTDMASNTMDPLFSTASASHLITLAKARSIDGYLLNIETDLNFLPPASYYPNKSQEERDEDATSFECEKRLAGLGTLISPDVQQRREWRMKINAATLSNWVKWFRDEGKRLVGPHWEVIWYDSVTTAGRLEWQDALTSANAPFFVRSDAIFTNYTWARPPDPAPPGGLQEPPRSPSEHHPSLLNSALMAKSLDRSPADVYIGIDVFGRNCYGGFEVGQSLDLIFVPHKQERPKAVHNSPPEGPSRDLQALGLSVALFAPGWTWEREKEGGGERSWDEWWEDELRFWVYGAIIAESLQRPDDKTHGRAVGDYFGPRERSFHWINPSPWLSQSSSLAELVTHPSIPIFEDRYPQQVASTPFYTNFNRGSGESWWVCGEKVYDAFGSSSSDNLTAKSGWTDIGSCFPKPDRIWPRLVALYAEDGDKLRSPKSLSILTRCGKWMVGRAALVDREAWHGGTSLEILLHILPDASLGDPVHSMNSPVVLPLCTLNGCSVMSRIPSLYSLEIVIKPLSLPIGFSELSELRLQPYIIWANNQPCKNCSYYTALPLSATSTPCELANGWYRARSTVRLDLVDPAGVPTSAAVVPVMSLAIDSPLSRIAAGAPSDLRLLVGEISLAVLPHSDFLSSSSSSGTTTSSPLAVLSAGMTTAGSFAEHLHWRSLPSPASASPTSLWGVLTWDGDGAPPSEREQAIHNVTRTTGYCNIFTSAEGSHGPHGTGRAHVWLGTSTYEKNPNSFVIAGLEPSNLMKGSSTSGKSYTITFCVHRIGAPVPGVKGTDDVRGALVGWCNLKVSPSQPAASTF